jgi:hypothetical protein
LEYLKLNIQIGNENQQVENPSRIHLVEALKIAQQAVVKRGTRELGTYVQQNSIRQR